MLPATIATSVAPETIAKVGRLFNGTLGDILHELLQNARRAGASAVEITLGGGPENRTLTIADDGHGIDDPATVVALGHSGWSPAIRGREDPAGMGVFSLAGRDVMIRSWSCSAGEGWAARIGSDDWETSAPVAVVSDPIARGTAISVAIPDAWTADLPRTVAGAARFYPLPVALDDAAMPKEDWLADAVHVESWRGCRIGVHRSVSCRHYGSDGRLNFHGVTIPCVLPHLSEVQGPCWTARVDIVDAPAIQLVLPARKEAVQNAALDALRDAVAAAIFRAIADQADHRLAFKDWQTARGLGVDLSPAVASLEAWPAPEPDTLPPSWIRPRVTGEDMVVMPDLEAVIAEPAKMAFRRGSPLPGPLAEAERAFDGYPWYDALRRVDDVRFVAREGGRSFELDGDDDPATPPPDGYVDALSLVLTLGQGDEAAEVTCEADVAFAGDPWGCDPAEEIGILIRRGSDLSVRFVVDLLEAAAFNASDDRDADSVDTQVEQFRAAASARVVRLLKGDDAALEHRVRAMLADYRWVVPADRTVAITLTSDGVEIAILPRQPAVA